MAFRTTGCLPPRSPVEGVELARGRVDDAMSLLWRACGTAPASELKLYAVTVLSRYRELQSAEDVQARARSPRQLIKETV